MMIGKSMHQAMRSMFNVLSSEFLKNSIPLSSEQYLILKIISKNKRVIQQELACILDKDKSTILRQINHLQDNLMVARIVDKTDKRKNLVMLTQKGMDVLNEAGAIHKNAVEILLKGVSKEQLESFNGVLERLYQNGINYKVDVVNQ